MRGEENDESSTEGRHDAAARHRPLGDIQLPDGDLPERIAAAHAERIPLYHGLSGAGHHLLQAAARREQENAPIQPPCGPVACGGVRRRDLRRDVYVRLQRWVYRRDDGPVYAAFRVPSVPQKAGQKVQFRDHSVSHRHCDAHAERDAQACAGRYHLPAGADVLRR